MTDNRIGFNMENRIARLTEQIRLTASASGRDPCDIALIAVSKGRSLSRLEDIYGTGIRRFGESRLQEALSKIAEMPSDCEWHFIGTLQSNKVGKVVSAFDFIHSVDTLALAEKISTESEKSGKRMPILLQVNTSGEVSKHGLSPDEWEKELERVNRLSNIRIEGLMTMAPLTADQDCIRTCFRKLYRLRENWRSRMKNPSVFHHLSMGMSDDFPIAIEEGATLLRLGTALFSSDFESRPETGEVFPC